MAHRTLRVHSIIHTIHSRRHTRYTLEYTLYTLEYTLSMAGEDTINVRLSEIPTDSGQKHVSPPPPSFNALLYKWLLFPGRFR